MWPPAQNCKSVFHNDIEISGYNTHNLFLPVYKHSRPMPEPDCQAASISDFVPDVFRVSDNIHPEQNHIDTTYKQTRCIPICTPAMTGIHKHKTCPVLPALCLNLSIQLPSSSSQRCFSPSYTPGRYQHHAS